ncbi:hypothetical protein WN944_026000 [Citrus x changshan-huyou]|uniref:Uncharacterized protein n=1 Tax=Citrus x changshan-huyou TaxID=2935761 RepID=A0AAP0LRN6_9ROSI
MTMHYYQCLHYHKTIISISRRWLKNLELGVMVSSYLLSYNLHFLDSSKLMMVFQYLVYYRWKIRLWRWGKPKRGRMAPTPRDGKRNRTTSEPDFDDEDDPDMISR